MSLRSIGLSNENFRGSVETIRFQRLADFSSARNKYFLQYFMINPGVSIRIRMHERKFHAACRSIGAPVRYVERVCGVLAETDIRNEIFFWYDA